MTVLDKFFKQLINGDDTQAEKAAHHIVPLFALQPVEVLQGVDTLLAASSADHRW